MRILAMLVAVVAALGCTKKNDSNGRGDDPNAAAEGRTKGAADSEHYQVRGRFLGVEKTVGLVTIHHESIPAFRNRSGQAVGMMSMQMAFRVAPGVSLDGFEAGEPVKIDFSVDWNEKPAIQIDSIEELPADTKLEL